MSCVRFSHALRTGRCTSRSSRLLSPQARGFCRPGSIIYRDLKQKDNKYNPCFAHFAIYTGDVGPYKACAIGANPGGIQIERVDLPGSHWTVFQEKRTWKEGTAVVQKALEAYKRRQWKYDVIFNNCEHFACTMFKLPAMSAQAAMGNTAVHACGGALCSYVVAGPYKALNIFSHLQTPNTGP
ncbi:KLHDC4 [Symbiodinium natans]|uniref:KLHDC4 protein n=1 Tax=Symbiodinium natans TaxID=878477 RepID=A0A812Q3M1_9DINO|nr:KLHDC4 [Symbiodinium natans]